VSVLSGLLSNADAGVKACAASALGGIGPGAAEATEALVGLLGDTGEDTTTFMLTIAGQQGKTPASLRKPACAAASALGKIGAKDSAPKLGAGLASPDYEVRKECAEALGAMPYLGVKFQDSLSALLEDSQPMVVAVACKALGSIAAATGPSMPVVDKLAECLRSPHPAVKSSALLGLGSMGDEASRFIDDYVKCFADPCGVVRAAAIEAITGSGEMGEMYASEVCRMMFDGDSKVRITALTCLPKMGNRGAAFAEEVCALLGDPLPEVRVAGLQCLGAFGPENYEPFLDSILSLASSDDSLAVRDAANAVATAKAALE
jgi:HEAT repeat protein